MKMKNRMENQVNKKQKPKPKPSETAHKEKLLLVQVQGSKSIEELCLKGGQTVFDLEKPKNALFAPKQKLLKKPDSWE